MLVIHREVFTSKKLLSPIPPVGVNLKVKEDDRKEKKTLTKLSCACAHDHAWPIPDVLNPMGRQGIG